MPRKEIMPDRGRGFRAAARAFFVSAAADTESREKNQGCEKSMAADLR